MKMSETTVQSGQVWSKNSVNFTVAEIVDKANGAKIVYYTNSNGKKFSTPIKYFIRSFTLQH